MFAKLFAVCAKKFLTKATLVCKIVKVIYLADIAQLAEQLICNQQVVGSIPIVGFSNTLRKVLFFYPSEIDGRAVGW